MICCYIFYYTITLKPAPAVVVVVVVVVEVGAAEQYQPQQQKQSLDVCGRNTENNCPTQTRRKGRATDKVVHTAVLSFIIFIHFGSFRIFF